MSEFRLRRTTRRDCRHAVAHVAISMRTTPLSFGRATDRSVSFCLSVTRQFRLKLFRLMHRVGQATVLSCVVDQHVQTFGRIEPPKAVANIAYRSRHEDTHCQYMQSFSRADVAPPSRNLKQLAHGCQPVRKTLSDLWQILTFRTCVPTELKNLKSGGCKKRVEVSRHLGLFTLRCCNGIATALVGQMQSHGHHDYVDGGRSPLCCAAERNRFDLSVPEEPGGGSQGKGKASKRQKRDDDPKAKASEVQHAREPATAPGGLS